MEILQDVANKFIAWTKLKIRIHHKDQAEIEVLYFREKEIWWTHLGKNIGHEQDGKNEQFERPMIILRKFNRNFFWGVPTSSKIKEENEFYHLFTFNEEIYSAIVSQMRPISAKRLIRKIGVLPKTEFETLKGRVVSLIKNDSRTK